MKNCIPIGMRFSIIHRIFRQRLNERLRAQELTDVQFGILTALFHMEHSGREDISQRDLEHATHVSHATMTELLQRLERKELVEIHPSEKDRRCKCIFSTERAHEVVHALVSADQEVLNELTAELTPEEKEHFMNTVSRLLEKALALCEKGSDECD